MNGADAPPASPAENIAAAAAIPRSSGEPAHPLHQTIAPSPAARLDDAVTALRRHKPAMSASTGLWPRQRLLLTGMASALVLVAMTAPSAASVTVQFVFAVAFAMLLCVRLLALHHALTSPQVAETPPAPWAGIGEPLPVYTILVALHAEVPVVPQLTAAMRALAYPSARLDIIFALEAHDDPTRTALLAQDLPPHMRLVIVPDGFPRTKPRALCYALTFARGDYVVVYDAEDLPDPNQLHRALAAFREGGATLGCVQARLAINNANGSWLATQFAIEYAALFDTILPAFAAHGLPVPLGGTSNHFARQALEQSGGWDPYNVTEDADLGVRLARSGWRVGVIPSDTWEEAPAAWQPWLAQRTRWQKGWLQTYFVHMREPAAAWRELGPASFVWFQIAVGGGLLSALAHPWFYALLALDWAHGRLFPPLAAGPSAWLWWTGIVNLALAAVATIALALTAVRRRRRPDLQLQALLAPLYWLPVSIAAYCAIAEWIRAPFYWAKTPHGVGAPSAKGG